MTNQLRLDTQTVDGTLVPTKISTNPLDTFVFPGDVTITGTVSAGSGAGGNVAVGGALVATVSLSGQVADIPATTLFTPTVTGAYRISAYTVYTAGDGTDTIATFNSFWTDNSAPQSGSGLTNATGTNAWGSGVIGGGNSSIGPGSGVTFSLTFQAVAGQPIQYSVTGGSYASSVYTIYIALEQLTQVGGGPTTPVTQLSTPTSLTLPGFYWIASSLLAGSMVLPDAATLPGQQLSVNAFQSPNPNYTPFSICTGPDGNLWWGDNNSRIFKLTPAGVFTKYNTPSTNTQVYGVCAGPDGNVWFCESGPANNIAVITPSGVITEYPIPTPSSSPFSICTGSDGNLWFTEFNANQIGMCTTAGVITEYPIPTPSSSPMNICSASDNNLWFTESQTNQIGKITTAGVITEFPTTTPAGPKYICQGPDTNLWFTEQADLIGVMDLAGAMVNEYATTSSPAGICVGPDSNLWFLLPSGSQVVKLTTGGSMTPYNLRSGGAQEICNGPDGNLWATNTNAIIYKITTAGVVYFNQTAATVSTIAGQSLDGVDTNLTPYLIAGFVNSFISDGVNWYTI